MRCRSDAFVGFKTILDSGKTFSLIYLLVVRILQKQPTFYQTRPDEIYLFCENSVYRLPTHKLKGPITPSELISDCAELGITLDNVDGPIFFDQLKRVSQQPSCLVLRKIFARLCCSSSVIGGYESRRLDERKGSGQICYEPLDMVRDNGRVRAFTPFFRMH